MKKIIETWTIETLKEDIKVGKNSLKKMKLLKQNEEKDLFFKLIKIDEFVEKFKYKNNKFSINTNDIEKLKSISQEEKQTLLDEKMMIEMFDENIKRIKLHLSTLSEKLKQMEDEEKSKAQIQQPAQQPPKETKSTAEQQKEMEFLLEYAKYLDEKRKQFDRDFDDIIKENLESAKKHLKKREKEKQS